MSNITMRDLLEKAMRVSPLMINRNALGFKDVYNSLSPEKICTINGFDMVLFNGEKVPIVTLEEFPETYSYCTATMKSRLLSVVQMAVNGGATEEQAVESLHEYFVNEPQKIVLIPETTKGGVFYYNFKFCDIQ